MTLTVINNGRKMFSVVLVNACAGNEPAYQLFTLSGEMASLLWTRTEAASVIRDFKTRYTIE